MNREHVTLRPCGQPPRSGRHQPLSTFLPSVHADDCESTGSDSDIDQLPGEGFIGRAHACAETRSKENQSQRGHPRPDRRRHPGYHVFVDLTVEQKSLTLCQRTRRVGHRSHRTYLPKPHIVGIPTPPVYVRNTRSSAPKEPSGAGALQK
jgi:hypothetical protein